MVVNWNDSQTISNDSERLCNELRRFQTVRNDFAANYNDFRRFARLNSELQRFQTIRNDFATNYNDFKRFTTTLQWITTISNDLQQLCNELQQFQIFHELKPTLQWFSKICSSRNNLKGFCHLQPYCNVFDLYDVKMIKIVRLLFIRVGWEKLGIEKLWSIAKRKKAILRASGMSVAQQVISIYHVIELVLSHQSLRMLREKLKMFLAYKAWNDTGINTPGSNLAQQVELQRRLQKLTSAEIGCTNRSEKW